MATLHKDDSSAPPCHSFQEFGLDLESASIFSYKMYLSTNSEAFICLAQRNVVKNAKHFIAGHNIACFTMGYAQGIMNCDVTAITTVSLFLDLS